MKHLNLSLLALLAIFASIASTPAGYAQTQQQIDAVDERTAADDPTVEPTDEDAEDMIGTSIPSANTNIPYAGSSLESSKPIQATNGGAMAVGSGNTTGPGDATGGSDTASTGSTPGTTPATPTDAYAPDQSGMTIREVKEQKQVTEQVVGENGAPSIKEETVEIPAMEIDFSGGGGSATVEFPTEEAGMEALMGEDDTISVDFPDEEVRTIIRNVADLYDLNVVIPDTLQGSTSIKLRNVTWRQVFEVVLEPLRYTYIVDRNIIKIKSIDELTNEPTVTRVFLINYAVADTLQSSLAPLIDSANGGRVQVDKRTNALLITERPSRMNDIQAIIERLDRPNPQVMIESKFIEINDEDRSDIGVNWASLQGYQINAGPFNRAYTAEKSKNTDDSVLTDRTTLADRQTSNSSSTNLDIPGGLSSNTASSMQDIANSAFNYSVLGDTNWINNVTRSDTAVFSADAFSVILSFLESNTDAKLVNNPTLVTLDGEEAKLVIGEQFPIPSYTFNDETGSFEVSGFEYKDIGTILSVTPNVNSAGFIRLNVRPVLSRSDGTTSFGGAGGAQIPVIQTTSTESNVILKDGFTLAIGGLIEELTSDQDSSVPYLSELPLLGELFQHSTKVTSRRNLVIFVTAKTLNPDGTTYKDIIDPRVLYQMGILENEIPGYVLPEEQASAYNQIMDLQTKFSNDKAQLELLERVSTLGDIDDENGEGSDKE
ncbi:type II secretion system protein GspD [Cerasicoccus fimbriatus]|uniref:type II secretion system protein GspD n=1 Tax=Cerasicoccus fimbriatus TaxID=3014554 RepID=UPI0022B4AD3F|nr:secretin N-terminal domain-containing protein [Cerasicoccus sp. TK19100]